MIPYPPEPTTRAHAGAVRFRPIVLTSLTTFVGLSPLLLNRSVQAQFLVPMACSLAFGVVLSTVVTLFIVPCGFVILEDLRRLRRRRREKAEAEGDLSASTPEPRPIP